MVLAYVAAESVLTYCYVQGILEPQLIWVVEQVESEQHMRAEESRGYWLSSKPARMACITTDGTIESQGRLRGNNYGFPDRDDFQPDRTISDQRRFAVFGDSFSAAPFLAVNWPDRVEDRCAEQNVPVQLLNFSVFGGGLANWWSVLTRFVEPENYELDAVIFAVFVDDLHRAFYVCDDTFHQRSAEVVPKLACGFSESFDPETFHDIDVKFMRHTRILPTATFDEALRGQWRPSALLICLSIAV